MKSVFLAIIAIIITNTTPLGAQEAGSEPVIITIEDVAEVRNSILAQLSAFREDNAIVAFSYASRGIRRLFDTPELFLEMVKKSYRELYRPQSFEFRPTTQFGDKVVQPLVVVGPSGLPKTVVYVMEKHPDGQWKISACFFADKIGKTI
ncbi:MAG: hypothetical protein CFH41_02317 [Alphaproteobacteria bacterium MarineAlpha11_Bin1]|nr:MAG: hypothetical protein CFH41_02317 [Alphaproteobacteria bacterium MarineAlpha11_Bin1]|tara:strand:+ start:1130 stop:1576 length:447 start_codon:yes stop_codon:yes gene_type:complete